MVKGVPFSAKLIAGGLILLALVYMVVPLFMVAASSVTESQFMSFPPKGFSLQWFSEVFHSEKYLESAWTSFKLAGVVVILSVTIGTMTALSLSRLRFRGGEALSGVFLSPLILPAIVFAIALLMYISLLGFEPSVFGLVIGHLVITLPYVVRTVSAVLARSDPFLEEAARTMGANWFIRYWKVVLPQCRQGIAAGAFFAFNISFDDAVIALFIRSPEIETLPIRIYSELEFSTSPAIAAVSTIMIILTIALIFIIERILGIQKVV
jgi:putative spermidine/putrescine transport system permease protein